jgi:glycosyltransferase involved in cell wall biosynthesis
MIHVAPFGSPITGAVDSSQYKSENKIRPLRVLFAGSMGQRKGLGDLFAAMKILNTKQIELIVMGSLLAPMEFYRQQFEDFTYEPGRPHEEVLALMKSCDIFCLPSIVEGRALVMQEAMSQGLPLIITPNTGGEDLILEGKTGFLVPISSPQAIAEKLNWFLENRRAIPDMAKFAQKHAAKYTWAAYGNGVGNAIKSNFKPTQKDLLSFMNQYNLSSNQMLSAYRAYTTLKTMKNELNILAGEYLSREKATKVIDRLNKTIDKSKITVGATSIKYKSF